MLKIIDKAEANSPRFIKRLADCVVVAQDGRLVMQERPAHWGRHAGVLNLFGGHVEDGETLMQALVRELKEEIGAAVDPMDVKTIGAIAEDWTDYSELVHVHFWRDKSGTITGCYEAEARYYDRMEDALAHPKIMEYAAWALRACQDRSLL